MLKNMHSCFFSLSRGFRPLLTQASKSIACRKQLLCSSFFGDKISTNSKIMKTLSSASLTMDAKLKTLFDHIDKRQQHYIDRLAEAVAIPSISAQLNHRDDCLKMIKWAQAQLERLGAKTEIKENPKKAEPVPFPPLLFGSLGADKNKKTIFIYGHLDVQPAVKSDGWTTDPWVLTEIDDKLFGRGATDDKGPVVDWINVVEAYKEAGLELPVNVKFIFECMEESGSEGLDEAIKQNVPFFDDVSFICIADNYWLSPTKPCLTYGLRGICYFFLTVECAARDLHSGIYGGAVHEAMWDLTHLMSSMVAPGGKINIPGLSDQVAKMTPEEEKIYASIHFDIDDFTKNEVGSSRLVHPTKELVLQHRWRYPSLSLHGIEGAFSEPGAKTVIPRKVIGKFSIRLVPHMTPDHVEKCVKDFLEKEFAKRNSPNKMTVTFHHGAPGWVGDVNHVQYIAGKRATRRVWGVDPDMTREGGSIPIVLSFEEHTGKKVMLLPVGQSDDGAHSNNEKIARKNYINGAKLYAAYFEEAAAL